MVTFNRRHFVKQRATRLETVAPGYGSDDWKRSSKKSQYRVAASTSTCMEEAKDHPKAEKAWPRWKPTD